MTNKELLVKLMGFYLTQDPKLVARALANATLDLHRVHTKDSLTHNQKFNLEMRLELNSAELMKFSREETQQGLQLIVMNSGD